MHPSPSDAHSTATAQWEKLPPELIHYIFHHAARLSTEFCLTLCRVSSWTRRLALPHLYSTVILKNYQVDCLYTQCLENPPFRPPEYDFEPKTALRSLWIEGVSYDVVSIFRECNNLVHLALNTYNFLKLVHKALGRRLSYGEVKRKGDLRLVIINSLSQNLAEYLSNSYVDSPFFSKITHLRLTDISGYQIELDITYFRRLTHLCVPFWLPTHNLFALNRALDHLYRIKVLAIAVYMDLVKDDDLLRVRTWFQERRKTDQRVYLIESRSDEIQKEWEREVRGGESIWGRALRSAETLQKEEY